MATKKSGSSKDDSSNAKASKASKKAKAAEEDALDVSFTGVGFDDEAAPKPKWRSIPIGSESEDEIDLNSVSVVARVTIASPDKVLEWSRRHSRAAERRPLLTTSRFGDDFDSSSFGEVKKPETINYRTFKPERDGLFCERIFGPTKDWECACGKYKRIKYKGIVCDRCGVEVIESKVRRTRMGHIKLAAPVVHIWFYKGTTSRISALLDITTKDLSKVIYFQNHIVVDAGDATEVKHKQILSDEDTRRYRDKYGDKIDIRIGAEAVRELLKQINVDELQTRLFIEMKEATSAQKRTKIIKRLKVVEAFRESSKNDTGNKPEWMVLEVLPVIPPELRPLVHLDGGRFASSDLNDLYRRVINRNNRLKKLMELKAPEVILRNEKRMLQEAVDALFDNSRRARPAKGRNNQRPLKSLSDMIKGKQGRFRQNLLGKRVDYSGRSVIVVGPELKFNECGLPKKMALELFEPFIIRELEQRGYTNTIKSAKKMMEKEAPEVYDILDDIIKDHPVLLNRAPTLHRLSVQAFMPKLVEGKAIQLHPLACTAFNADFDGDQMAVHVPLSVEAKLEAKNLMLAENNILSPASGKPICTPAQDMVLGIFYMTQEVLNQDRFGQLKEIESIRDLTNVKDAKVKEQIRRLLPKFTSIDEVVLAYNHKAVRLQERVVVRLEDGTKVETTPGRVLFSLILPKEVSFFDKELPFANKALTKGALGTIVAEVHKRAGKKVCARMLDDMKNLGYTFAKRAGISISMNDMIVPERKTEILDRTKRVVEEVEKNYKRGLITNNERYSKIIHEWSIATDDVASEMMSKMTSDQHGLNPIYMMAFSGARGNEAQIRQLAGMRGLMQKPTKKITGDVGEIIENPITSNFREGLTVLEYFISTHGARKGLADTALKTSDAGYLTRRLVDVAQDLFINELDCGTEKGIEVEAITETTRTGTRDLEPLEDRITGRVALVDIVHPNTGEVIAPGNTEILEATARRIKEAGIRKVSIRSVLTCEAKRGVCAQCYGRNMATMRMVEVGEAVGVIAAQSIGEPGTQLTLRTFHIGGTASVTVEGWYQASHDGQVVFNNLKTLTTGSGKNLSELVTKRGGEIIIKDANDVEVQKLPDIAYGARLKVKDGDIVKRGDRIVEWDPHYTPIIAETSGEIRLVDIVDGDTMRREINIETETEQRSISDYKNDKHPSIVIVDGEGNELSKTTLSSGTILAQDLRDGLKVVPGQVLARIPRARTKSKDITGGLPRVDELFEGRKPKDAAIIADVDGVVHQKGTTRGQRKVSVTTDAGEERVYSVPLNRQIQVRDGERVEAGDALTDGSESPHDVLAVKGNKTVMEFLVKEVQEVYRLQKVNINDKHIECIVRQMLKKVIVEDVGDTQFLFGQQVDSKEFEEQNRKTEEMGGRPAKCRPKLLGLTKASLETESFISAASFQETTRVLTDAAIRGKIDNLRGLKENVIMGLLIPAGSGNPAYRNIDVVNAEQYAADASLAESLG